MVFWKCTERLTNWSAPYTKREIRINEPTTAASLCLTSQEERMPRCRENNWIKAGWYPERLSSRPYHYIKISTLQQIFEKSWEHAKDVDNCFVDLGKVYGRVPREKLWGVFGGVVGVRCWRVSLSGHQVTVFLSEDCVRVNVVKSQLFSVGLLPFVCAVTTPLHSPYQGSPNCGPRTTSDLRSHFTWPQNTFCQQWKNNKLKNVLSWIGRMQHNPKKNIMKDIRPLNCCAIAYVALSQKIWRALVFSACQPGVSYTPGCTRIFQGCTNLMGCIGVYQMCALQK